MDLGSPTIVRRQCDHSAAVGDRLDQQRAQKLDFRLHVAGLSALHNQVGERR